jgi:hypothetical protein
LTYRVGFACNEESEAIAIKTMEGFVVDMIADLFIGQELTWRLLLSGKENFRNEIAVTAPYKGNRTKDKPVHIEALRDYLVDVWGATVSKGQEADDDIAIAATSNPDAVICSVDKDFYQVPGKNYNFVTKEYKDISEEEALIWPYMQMLMGDGVDNIKGVKGLGLVKSRKLLEGKTEAEMWQTVVDCLGSEERALENGQLLWLRREPNQMWQPPQEKTT